MIRELTASSHCHVPQTLSKRSLDELSSQLDSLIAECLGEISVELGPRQEKCFERAFTFLKAGDWETLAKMKAELSPLTDLNGEPPLFKYLRESEEEECINAVKELQQRGLLQALSNGRFQETLFAAAKVGKSTEVIKALKGAGCNPAKKTPKNRYPLHAAIRMNHPELVQPLLPVTAKGVHLPAMVLTYPKFGVELCPFSLAVYKGHVECLEELHKVHPNQLSLVRVGYERKSLLHLAILVQQHEMLRHLVTIHKEETACLINMPDSLGTTPLMLAARMGDLRSMDLLVEHGAKVNQCDGRGRSAMHYAVEGMCRLSVYLLLKRGGDLFAPDNEGRAPGQILRPSEDEGPDLELFLEQVNQISVAVEGKKRSGLINYYEEPIEGMTWMGGGPAGLTYLGTCRVLSRRGLLDPCKRQAGSSAGSIMATFIAGGATVEELEKLLAETPGKYFFDVEEGATGSLEDQLLKKMAKELIMPLVRCLTNPTSIATLAETGKKLLDGARRFTGICKGKHFLQWIERELSKLTGMQYCTFGELAELVNKGARSAQGRRFQHLHIFAINLSTSKIIRFSSEDPHCSEFVISSVVRCSMSIPGLYIPMTPIRKVKTHAGITFCTEKGELGRGNFMEVFDAVVAKKVVNEPSYCDPGVIYNCPFTAFDWKRYCESGYDGQGADLPQFNRRTLGFALGASPQEEVEKVKSLTDPLSLIKAYCSLYGAVESAITDVVSSSGHRVLTLDRQGIKLTEFSATPTSGKGKKAIEEAEKKTEAFFKEQEEAADRLLQDLEAGLPASPQGPVVVPAQQVPLHKNQPLVVFPHHRLLRKWIISGLTPSAIAKNFWSPSLTAWHLDFSYLGQVRSGSREIANWLLNKNPALLRFSEMLKKKTPRNLVDAHADQIGDLLSNSQFSQQILPFWVIWMDREEIEYFSARKLPLHVQFQDGTPVLHNLLTLECESRFEALILAQDYKVDKDAEGNTILHKIIQENYPKAFEILESKGKLPELVNVKNHAGEAPLITALNAGYDHFFDSILAQKETELTCLGPRSGKTVLRILADAGKGSACLRFIETAKERGVLSEILELENASKELLIFKLAKGPLLKALMENGIDLTKTDKDTGKTLLYFLAKENDVEYATLFCEQLMKYFPEKYYATIDYEVHSSQINKATKAPMKKTALMIAAEKNHHAMVKLLVGFGADYLKKVDGKTAIECAPTTFLHKQSHALLSTANSDQKDRLPKEKITDFRLACKHGKKSRAKLLIESRYFRISEDKRDAEGNGFLLTLIKSGGGFNSIGPGFAWSDVEELVTLAIQEGDRVNQADCRGRTPLMLAAREKLSLVKLLLACKGLDINQADKDGNTALHHAVSSKCAERLTIVQTLIKQGADPDHLNHENLSPKDLPQVLSDPPLALTFAEQVLGSFEKLCKSGNKEKAEALIKEASFFIKLSAVTNTGYGFLLVLTQTATTTRENKMGLSWAEKRELAQLMIDQGVDVNLGDFNGTTPLMYAARQHFELLEALLACKDIKVNLADVRGNTALHYAVMNGRPRSAEALLKKGATTSHKNKEGQTPCDLAQLSQKEEMKSLLMPSSL